jgi:ribokinase
VSAVADGVDRVRLEDLAIADAVFAHPAPDLDDRRPVVAVSDLVLLARGMDRRHARETTVCAVTLAVVGHAELCHFAEVDHVPAPGEIVEATDGWEEPAGGGAVAAVQIAKLAGECLFLTALGDDEAGHRTKQGLEELGLRVEAAWRPGAQRRAFVHLDKTGERTITTVGERLLPRGDDPLPWSELEGAEAVYVTAGDAGAARAARAARRLVATVRGREAFAGSGVQADVLVASAADQGERYAPGDFDPPPAAMVLTAGAEGGVLESGGERTPWAAVPLPGPRVDEYGAGDSFAGGLTYALGAGHPLERAIGVGSRCGAANITGRGPYEAQLTAATLHETIR